MHPETKEISTHMKEFGFNIIGRAIHDATFAEIMRPFAHILSVVHTAHGAEIIIKARIAEEHPLLIFKDYPKSNKTTGMLSIKELLEDGRTLIYSELPEVLWASTGYRIQQLKRYQEFGKLRNRIIHFAAPNVDASTETLKFIFELLDPIVIDFWNESIVDYSENWDDAIIEGGYLQDQLKSLNIQVHPEAQKLIDKYD